MRKAIIQTLAVEGAQTARALETEVGKLLPAAEKPSVKEQLQVLCEGGYVEDAEKQRRRFQLSDSGRRWWEGIQALTPRAA